MYSTFYKKKIATIREEFWDVRRKKKKANNNSAMKWNEYEQLLFKHQPMIYF